MRLEVVHGTHACHHPHFIHGLSLHPAYQLSPPAPKGKTQTPLNVQNLSNRSPPGFRDISVTPRVSSPMASAPPHPGPDPWSPHPSLHWCASPEVVGCDALPHRVATLGATGPSSEAAGEATTSSGVKASQVAQRRGILLQAGDPGSISSGEGSNSPLQSSFLEIPWTEEPGGLLWGHRVGRSRATKHTHKCHAAGCWCLPAAGASVCLLPAPRGGPPSLCLCLRPLPHHLLPWWAPSALPRSRAPGPGSFLHVTSALCPLGHLGHSPSPPPLAGICYYAFPPAI